jgi:Zn-dependent M28 family amino/carboxypeptidase
MNMKIYVSVFAVVIFCYTAAAQQKSVKLATEAEIKEAVALAPCKDKDRLEAVKKLFVNAGAAESDISIEKIKSVENLSVTKKGKSDSEIVVVGAHYDKVAEGCGAIDNWTGIVILANLYRSMKDLDTQKTYIFAAFGKEEVGLVGSEAMADKIPKEKRLDYCAMVNFDSFGFTYPQPLRNISDTSLIDLAKEVSGELKIPFGAAGIELASSDSESFRQKKIPAISFHGLDNRWQNYLHNSSDKVENVNAQSVYVGYRYGLVFLSKIESRPCAAFRK